MTRAQSVGFEVSISSRDDGTVQAAYISLSDAKVAKTKPIIEDILLADYSARGTLVGIEILAPVKVADLVKLVDKSKRERFRRFITRATPQDLVTL
jgi:uncharacterized protein YuzE